MICDCGRLLEPYIVKIDGEQYVEDLCPHCAFPTIPDPKSGLIMEMPLNVRFAGSKTPLSVESCSVSNSIDRGAVVELTISGTTQLFIGDSVDLEMNGIDMGPFFVEGHQRTSHTGGITTEVRLIGAK